MGIVVDCQNTKFDFQDPKRDNVTMDSINNDFSYVMHKFTIQFGFSFDPDTNIGVPRRKTLRKELWEIGIIQNVVFEMMNFEYDDGTVHKTEFKDAVLDSVAMIHPPFYHDPVIVPGCEIDPDLSCSKYIPLMVPVADIWYTSQGYGELLDPWDKSGVATNNKPDSLDMQDEPNFGARLRLENRSLIRRVAHILSFQTWFVAKAPQETHILANIPTFSLVFWLETDPTPGLLLLGTPKYRSNCYSQKGIANKVHPSGAQVKIRAGLGEGGRYPNMDTSVTANVRGRRWLRANGLVPKRAP